MKKKTLANHTIIVAISLYLLLPLLLTFVYSIFTEWSQILPTGMTFRFYTKVLSDPLFLLSLLRSLLISILPVLLCTITMLLVLFVTTLFFPKIERAVEILCTIPYSIQGIIIAVAIISLYSGMHGLLGNRILLLIGTYCIIILPYIYRGLKNSLHAIHVHTLIEAAQMLGCHKAKAYVRVILPNMKSGIMSSMMISIAMIFSDFVIVNTIGGSYYQTASIYLYKAMSKSGQMTSAIIVILFLTTLAISMMATYMEKKTNRGGEN